MRSRGRFHPAGQLALALSGQAVTAYAVSVIVTSLPTGGASFPTVTDVEGMWAALLAGSLSALLQALTDLDAEPHGRAHLRRRRSAPIRGVSGPILTMPLSARQPNEAR